MHVCAHLHTHTHALTDTVPVHAYMHTVALDFTLPEVALLLPSRPLPPSLPSADVLNAHSMTGPALGAGAATVGRIPKTPL